VGDGIGRVPWIFFDGTVRDKQRSAHTKRMTKLRRRGPKRTVGSGRS
jgi:hypothetical protein